MTTAGTAIAALDAAVDGLLAVDLDALSDEELLQFTVSVERVVRRSPAVQDRVTAAVDGRGLAHSHGCSTTAALLRQLLRLSRSEATARVAGADRFAQRRAITGEPLEPRLPAVAAARATGEISPKHATDIARTIDALPAEVDEAGQVAAIKASLVDNARQFTPEELAQITHRLLATLKPDGTLAEVEYREQRRDVTIHQRTDGSVCGTFEGTAEFGELLLTLLDVLAAPNPAEDGTPDLRAPGQRRHDGLLAAFRLVLRANHLPTANGVVATIVLTATDEQWATDTGLATTGHGALVPIAEAKNIARGDARVMTTTLDRHGGITGWTDTRRLFTENQRLAMTARDHGCTFPGCTVPPLWCSLAPLAQPSGVASDERASSLAARLLRRCEADHVHDHARGGPTTTANGHLACGYHHRSKNRGWTVHMTNGRPDWTAPAWLDPTRTPRRNHVHDPVGVLC